MSKQKKAAAKEFSRNVQLENALDWLRAMKVLKTSKELATKMIYSEASISEFLNFKRPVSDGFAYRFEEMYLRKEKLTLKDFEKPVLNNQTKQLQRKDLTSTLEMLNTRVLYIEGGVQTILDKLDKLEKQNIKLNKTIGELLRTLKKSSP